MGIFRKATSVTTLGLVDFRSDKERVARSTRLTKQAVKDQNKLLKKQNRLIAQQNHLLMQPEPKPQHVEEPVVKETAQAKPTLGGIEKDWYKDLTL